MKTEYPTWEEMLNDKPGKIYADWFDGGIRCLIMRGPVSLCAYMGIPENHPLANRSYDDIPLNVHGGLTFSGKGKGNYPSGFYWYGWDYGHAGDFAFYYDEINKKNDDKKWLVKYVEQEINWALYDFKKLVKLVE